MKKTIKKAQKGSNIKSKFESSKNPKLILESKPGYDALFKRAETDTTGYAAGKKSFPTKYTYKPASNYRERKAGVTKDLKTGYTTIKRRDIKKALNKGPKKGISIIKEAKRGSKVPNGPLIKKKGPFKGSTLKHGGKLKK